MKVFFELGNIPHIQNSHDWNVMVKWTMVWASTGTEHIVPTSPPEPLRQGPKESPPDYLVAVSGAEQNSFLFQSSAIPTQLL